jgi:hypothetical protein
MVKPASPPPPQQKGQIPESPKNTTNDPYPAALFCGRREKTWRAGKFSNSKLYEIRK